MSPYPLLLASGSRDRLVHVFRADQPEFPLLCTLDDHSSSVTFLQFMDGGRILLSASSDKSIILRELKQVKFTKNIIHVFLLNYLL